MIYKKTNDYILINDKMQNMLNYIEEESVDAIICDPPYELNFMNKGWDNSGVAFQKDTWSECFKVLKRGGYLLAFGGSRTFHKIACAIENAGFEIRDTIMWLYGSGFPKSNNIGLSFDKRNNIDNRKGNIITNGAHNGKHFDECKKSLNTKFEERISQNEWKGWGTCLKPAYEPIIVARKPFNGSLLENIEKNGVGGLNIDECRVGNEHFDQKGGQAKTQCIYDDKVIRDKSYDGRFPSNVITDGSEEVAIGMPNTKSRVEERNDKHSFKGNKEAFQYGYKHRVGSGYDDEGSAMRYFYSAKASKKDRDEGLNDFVEKVITDGCIRSNQRSAQKFGGNSAPRKNIHPTVKPTELMQYLVRLVTPKNGTILDCFMGSGSTGKAVMFENRERQANYKFVGIEMTDEYLPICAARIDYALNKYEYDERKEKEERKEKGIIDIFDLMEE